MRITCKPDCGNSPKMEMIRKLCIALACADTNLISELVTSDVTLNVVGGPMVQGIDDLHAVLSSYSGNQVQELDLATIVSHGRSGAVQGTFNLENGQVYAFSGFFTFSNAKGTEVKEISTFIIPLPQSGAMS